MVFLHLLLDVSVKLSGEVKGVVEKFYIQNPIIPKIYCVNRNGKVENKNRSCP